MKKHGSRREQGPSSREGHDTQLGITRRNFIKYSAGAAAGVCLGSSLLGGCGGGTSDPPLSAVVLSDIHFNPFYDPSLLASLMTTDPSGWAPIFQRSIYTAPSSWGFSLANTRFDTNYALLAMTLTALRQNLGASPVVIYAGDILGHSFSTYFYMLNGWSPTNPTPAQAALMTAFADNTLSFVMQQVRSVIGNVPVLFALGNCDSYTGNGPDSAFLSNTVQLYYSQFLNGITDQQIFTSTFTSGGYYSASIPGLNLAVIGLNTYECSPTPFNGATAAAVSAQLAWLNTTLASAQAAGKNVWLLMHLPLGADEYSTAQSISGGRISNATMYWDANQGYQTSFFNILSNYPGLVTFILGAHTHDDEYRILLPGQALNIPGGISPIFGNNPSFKVYTFDRSTLNATDYTSFNLDPSAASPQFNNYYTFSAAYGTQGSLNNSLTLLQPLLKTDAARRDFYRAAYPSGHAYSIAVNNEFNPITDQTWPVYWAGIGNMESASIINAVNTY